jgi:hypothetical protein
MASSWTSTSPSLTRWPSSKVILSTTPATLAETVIDSKARTVPHRVPGLDDPAGADHVHLHGGGAARTPAAGTAGPPGALRRRGSGRLRQVGSQ